METSTFLSTRKRRVILCLLFWVNEMQGVSGRNGVSILVGLMKAVVCIFREGIDFGVGVSQGLALIRTGAGLGTGL